MDQRVRRFALTVVYQAGYRTMTSFLSTFDVAMATAVAFQGMPGVAGSSVIEIKS